jgi:hypothetical protein
MPSSNTILPFQHGAQKVLTHMCNELYRFFTPLALKIIDGVLSTRFGKRSNALLCGGCVFSENRFSENHLEK